MTAKLWADVIIAEPPVPLCTKACGQHLHTFMAHIIPPLLSAEGPSTASNYLMRKAHRHVGLPAKVVPVEGDGGVVKERVLIKVPVEHGNRPSSALQPSAPDLRPRLKAVSRQPPHVIGCDRTCKSKPFAGAALLMYCSSHRLLLGCSCSRSEPDSCCHRGLWAFCRLHVPRRHTSSDPCFQIRSPGVPRGSWLTAMSSSDISTPRASFVICLYSACAHVSTITINATACRDFPCRCSSRQDEASTEV